MKVEGFTKTPLGGCATTKQTPSELDEKVSEKAMEAIEFTQNRESPVSIMADVTEVNEEHPLINNAGIIGQKFSELMLDTFEKFTFLIQNFLPKEHIEKLEVTEDTKSQLKFYIELDEEVIKTADKIPGWKIENTSLKFTKKIEMTIDKKTKTISFSKNSLSAEIKTDTLELPWLMKKMLPKKISVYISEMQNMGEFITIKGKTNSAVELESEVKMSFEDFMILQGHIRNGA